MRADVPSDARSLFLTACRPPLPHSPTLLPPTPLPPLSLLPLSRSIGLPLNPYHVKVVPHAKAVNKLHFTLGLGGVMRTCTGEEPEFTPLEVWKRECYVFESLIEIPVFSRYKWWKNFKVWKQNVRYSKFVKNRESFQRQSVLMNPIMYVTLLRLRDQAQPTTSQKYSLLYKVQCM